MLATLSNPAAIEALEATPQGNEELDKIRNQFRISPARQKLQDAFDDLTAKKPEIGGWFLNDASGVQIARSPQKQPSGEYYPTIGRYFGWRSYFQGGSADEDKSWALPPDATLMIRIFPTPTSVRPPTVGSLRFPPPYFQTPTPKRANFIGVVSLMVEIGRFVTWRQKGDTQMAVLADWREGSHKGLILQHPQLDILLEEKKRDPDTLTEFKVDADSIARPPCRVTYYHDPLAQPQNGKQTALAGPSPTGPRS